MHHRTERRSPEFCSLKFPTLPEGATLVVATPASDRKEPFDLDARSRETVEMSSGNHYRADGLPSAPAALIAEETDLDTVALLLFGGLSNDPPLLRTDGSRSAIRQLSSGYDQLRFEWSRTGVWTRMDLDELAEVVARVSLKEGAMKLLLAGAEREPPGGPGWIAETRHYAGLHRRVEKHRRGARVWLTLPPGRGRKTIPKQLPPERQSDS
jgi:hypothetical protein